MKKIILLSLLFSMLLVSAVSARHGDLILNSVVIKDGGVVSIEGCIESDVVCAVSITVRDPNNRLNHIAQILTNENGAFSYSYKLNDKKDAIGDYLVKVKGTDVITPTEYSIYYVNKMTLNAITSDINNAESISDVETVVSTNLKAFQAYGALKNGVKSDTCYNLFSHKPYSKFEDMCTKLNGIEALLIDINNCDWSNLAGLIVGNSSLLLIDSDKYNYYCNLSGNNQKYINKEIVKQSPFGSIVSFEDVVEKCVEDYRESITEPIKKSGRDRGDRGTSINISQAVPVNNDIPDVKDDTADSKYFDDLDQAKWAKEYINNLCSKGVISASADRMFRPLDKIRREEFIKLLIEGFGLTDNEAACTYDDVSDLEWYARYIATAQKLKIVYGNENNCFGIDDYITRQDMSVMAHRLLGAIGKSLINSQEKIMFKDENEIDDYALDAVYKLQQASVISGLDNGNFGPKLNATRAEAVKIISIILNNVN